MSTAIEIVTQAIKTARMFGDSPSRWVLSVDAEKWLRDEATPVYMKTVGEPGLLVSMFNCPVDIHPDVSPGFGTLQCSSRVVVVFEIPAPPVPPPQLEGAITQQMTKGAQEALEAGRIPPEWIEQAQKRWYNAAPFDSSDPAAEPDGLGESQAAWDNTPLGLSDDPIDEGD